ncbi:MAG: hypothetical protein ACD_37C00274G0002 [uncultured bacterium]|nr:MAG: hypothetical protein ACD_37C00274G0002 [uncultured bacterium]
MIGEDPSVASTADRGIQEAPRPLNSFKAFIGSNADIFSAYGSSVRELRDLEKEWKPTFAQLFDRTAEQIRFRYPRAKSNTLDVMRRQAADYIFNGVKPENPLVWPSSIDEFGASYGLVAGPVANNANALLTEVSERLGLFLTSRYGSVVDMSQYLAELKEGQENDLISPYFRTLVKMDNDRRRRGDKGSFSPIKEHWQASIKSRYIPEVFQRFWERATAQTEASSSRLVKWVIFGASIGASMRDESRVITPSSGDIMLAISRMSFETWPPELQEAYVKFGSDDIAKLFEGERTGIRVLLQHHFPPQADVQLATSNGNGVSNGDKKRHNGGDADHSEIPEPSQHIEPEATRKLNLAILKRSGLPGRQAYHLAETSPELEEEEIRRLAEAGVTPGMRADLQEVLRKMMDPDVVHGSGAVKLKHLIIRIDGAEYFLRRLDPRAISGLTFRDAETARSRIIFALRGDTVMVEGIYPTHDAFDKRVGNGYR